HCVCHCEERSDEAVQGPRARAYDPWIASLRGARADDLLVEALARIRMGLDPMAGGVPPARGPQVLVPPPIVAQPFEAGSASRMPGQPHVQTDRHHFRLGRTLAIEHVESVANESEPVIGRADRAGVFAVVVSQRVGHNEMRLALDRLPERKL